MRLSFSGCGRAKRWIEGKDSKKFGGEEPRTRQPVDCPIFSLLSASLNPTRGYRAKG